MQLLVVEDDDHVAGALVSVLGRHGYEVVRARDDEGEAAGAQPLEQGGGVEQDPFTGCGLTDHRGVGEGPHGWAGGPGDGDGDLDGPRPATDLLDHGARTPLHHGRQRIRRVASGG